MNNIDPFQCGMIVLFQVEREPRRRTDSQTAGINADYAQHQSISLLLR
jgi:hypothetical protein